MKINIKKKNIFFSIVTVVLNQTKISKTIKSLKSQKYKNFEHIIIDGGSTDGTIDIIKKNQKFISYWESKKDRGIYHAMNKGIMKANGDIIAILNADDYFYPNALKIAKKYFEKYSIDFLFGTVIKDRILAGYWPKKINWKFNIYPSHSCSFFIKKNIHNEIGKYNEKFKYSADRDLIYRLIKKGKIGMCTKKNEVFGKFCTGGMSSKLSFFRTLKEEFSIRIHNDQNFIFLFFLFISVIFNKIYNKFIKFFLNFFSK